MSILDLLGPELWKHNATQDVKRKRSSGWYAVCQTRCDICGRFVSEGAHGVSWSQRWSYDSEGVPDLHDPTFRCSPCTDKQGIKPSNCQGKYSGRNGYE